MFGRKKVTEVMVQKRLADGHGAGVGKDYKPWMVTRSFMSKGNRHRMPSPKLGRTLHLFSNIERSAFLNAACKPNLLEYYDQMVMEREVTMAVAKSLGIKHPVFPGSDGVPYVMTLDGVAEYLDSKKGVIKVAYDSKHSSMLSDHRTLEKLKIHKGYCDYKGYEHIIVTEKTFPETVTRNLEWIHMGERRPLEVERIPGLFTQLPLLMLSELSGAYEDVRVPQYAQDFERRWMLPAGTGIRLIQILLWKGRLSADLRTRRIPTGCISELPVVMPLSLTEQAGLLQWRAAQ